MAARGVSDAGFARQPQIDSTSSHHPRMTRPLTAAAALLLGAASCVHQPPTFRAPPLGVMPFPVDSSATQVVADGVARRMLHSPAGPWTIHVLYVDLDRCNAVEAVKGADSVNGRFRVTDVLARLATREQVVGGVNGDFFDLKTGAPTNLLVSNGRMVTPPNRRPVLAFDSAGAPFISTFTLEDGRLRPTHPMNAVGGMPQLLRDSAVVDAVDTAGPPAFRERNPRTAAGIARNRSRLILVAVDGREYHNAGMTLRETAELMRALGARDAINLDGGGSTTLVYADPDSAGALRIANHPSDRDGERSVGDALAVVHACHEGSPAMR